jgi:REP-associated tyrosine transposase
MAAPPRGNTGYSVYFITASTFQKRSLFQSERMAQLFIEVLLHYGTQRKYLLHEFVLMPDHFHVLITPTITLERALHRTAIAIPTIFSSSMDAAWLAYR